MPLAAVILAFASAILHAFWNVLLKKAKDLDSASSGVFAVALLLSAATIPFTPGRAFPDVPAVLWGLAAGVCEGCYFVGLVRSLEQSPLGWSYTWMRGSSIALVWPASVLLMSEPFHGSSLVSVIIVCAGLGLLGAAPGRAKARSALPWAVLTGMFIASFSLFYKLSLGHGAQPLALFSLSMAVGLPIQSFVRIRRRGVAAFRILPTQPWLVLSAGFLCTTGFTLFLVALSLSGAAAVTTIRNSSVAFAMVFSLALGERPGLRQWIGAALVVFGAAGLGWH